jgi:hypothetical protein
MPAPYCVSSVIAPVTICDPNPAVMSDVPPFNVKSVTFCTPVTAKRIDNTRAYRQDVLKPVALSPM